MRTFRQCRSARGRWPAVILFALVCFGFHPAQAVEPVTVRSQSGQFIVRGIPMGPPLSGFSTSSVQYLRLDPTLTAVSLERVRQTILAELGLPDRWRGLISVSTRPVREDDLTARVTSVRYKDGWGYQLDLPERIDKDRFVRVAVRVILLEIANRTAVGREAELPPWLVEGWATELQATALGGLALEPARPVDRMGRSGDTMVAAREVLRRRPALKWDELSMPLEDHLSEANIGLYRACSHVFVRELLRFRDGKECLRDFLTHLPENLNWQTTFLRAFSGHFQRLIDVDKWYTLGVVNLTGRDPFSVLPAESAWKQLEDILATPVQVRLAAGDLPIHTTVSLQRIITEWDFAQQQPALAQKINLLKALRFRAPSDLAELAEGYSTALETYASSSSAKKGTRRKTKSGAAKLPASAWTLLGELDALDLRREALKNQK